MSPVPIETDASGVAPGRASGSRPLTLMVAGEAIELLPERAVFWPRRRTVMVADLHLGKEETFRQAGVPMPIAILGETLNRLDRVVARTGADRIVVVGDLVHARRGLTPAVVSEVAVWRRRFHGTVELVAGNHDQRVELPSAWSIDLRDAARTDPDDGCFRFVHEPPDAPFDAAADPSFFWCGHWHPTIRLHRRLDRVVLPCFALRVGRGILPAFTAFARGVGMDPAVDRIFAIADGAIVEVAADRCSCSKSSPPSGAIR